MIEPGSDLHGCAQIVERGDPDRFAASMAAPAEARRVLFPIYAFNVEIARAPWVTEEPLIAEMRLQWWQDALDEIAGGGAVRRHEVVTPLADVLDADAARVLGACVEARRRDARREPVESASELQRYVEETGGALMWAVTCALMPDGARPDAMERRARSLGAAQGLANYLLAVPAFLERGINPLPEMTEGAFATLLQESLKALDANASGRGTRAQRIAELAAWRSRGLLRRALRDPAAVPEGRLAEPEARRRLGLAWAAFGL